MAPFLPGGSAKGRIVVRTSLVLLLLVAIPTVAWAKTFHCTGGDVGCLIAAIDHANASQRGRTTIVLGPGTYTLTAVNNVTEDENGLPVIDSRVTIKGMNAEQTTIERSPSAPPFRILYVTAQGSLKLQGVTVRGGLLSTDELLELRGGGILSHGPLTVTQSIITENRLDAIGTRGGAIFSDDVLTIERSVISRNRSGSDGICGGVDAGGRVAIHESTISQNSAGFEGGGLCTSGQARITDSAITGNGSAAPGVGGIRNSGELTIINTTIAGNGPTGISTSNDVRIRSSTIVDNFEGIVSQGVSGAEVTLQNTIVALNSLGDCRGAVTSLGNNLIGDPTGLCMITLLSTDLTGDPGLGSLADDGTPGNGHLPLLATSQAIDAGNHAACPRRDQLGEKRRRPCDIGSIEFSQRPR
jgi:hypothetical protein